jgi:hypothetical protein
LFAKQYHSENRNKYHNGKQQTAQMHQEHVNFSNALAFFRAGFAQRTPI